MDSLEGVVLLTKCRNCKELIMPGCSTCKSCQIEVIDSIKSKGDKKNKNKKVVVTNAFFGDQNKRKVIESRKKVPKEVCSEADTDRIQRFVETSKNVDEWQRHSNKARLSECKSRAADMGIKWDIDDFVAVAMINNPCTYSALNGHNWIGLSDQSKYYTEDNAFPCDKIVYTMSGKLKKTAFIDLCQKIHSGVMDPSSTKMAMSMATRFDKCVIENSTFKHSFKDVCRLVSENNFS